MGDCNIVKSNEKQGVQRIEDMSDVDLEHATQQQTAQVAAMNNTGAASQQATGMTAETGISAGPSGVGASTAKDIDNVMLDEMIDINRFRYNEKI